MPKIVKVEAFDSDFVLDVHLDNGNTILLDISSKMSNPLFAALKKGDAILHMHTDGRRVLWENGASLSMEEILNMIQSTKEEEN